MNTMWDENKLRERLKTLAAEMCMKIGCVLPSLILNEPKDCLARLMGVPQEELMSRLAGFSGVAEDGDVGFEEEDGMIHIRLSAGAMEAAYREKKDDAFLAGLVKLATSCAGMADYRRFFEEFGNAKFVESQDCEYDWLVFYPEGVPSADCYCLKDEGGVVDYHRYTREDFEAMTGTSCGG